MADQCLFLRDWFAEVYVPRRLQGRAAATVEQHLIAIGHLEKALGRPAVLHDLSEEVLVGLQSCQVLRRGAASTVNKILNFLLAQARYAAQRGYLSIAPEVLDLPEPKRIPTAYTPIQVSRLFHAAIEEDGSIAGIPAGMWWLALLEFLYWTGARIRAALLVLRANVDLNAATVLLAAETQKHRADQLLTLHPDCVEAIGWIWEPPRTLLFRWPHHQTTLYRRYERILKRAGLPFSRRDKFQRLRRTCYSWTMTGGADAGWQLGHSGDLSRYYEDPSITQQRQACDVLPRPVLPSRLRIIG